MQSFRTFRQANTRLGAIQWNSVTGGHGGAQKESTREIWVGRNFSLSVVGLTGRPGGVNFEDFCFYHCGMAYSVAFQILTTRGLLF